jgi:uncharacterized membrane protein YjgN (DUF898 family)
METAVNASTRTVHDESSKSYYDASTIGGIGIKILTFLMIVLTLGLLYPWAAAISLDFKTRHTVIEGKRLHFTGTGMGLFGNYIKWWLLCFVTLGIYLFWLSKKMYQWQIKHTHFN